MFGKKIVLDGEKKFNKKSEEMSIQILLLFLFYWTLSGSQEQLDKLVLMVFQTYSVVF